MEYKTYCQIGIFSIETNAKIAYNKHANMTYKDVVKTMDTLRQLRKAVGLSESEVAHQLGVKQATFCRYENYNRALPQKCIRPLTKLYKVSVEAMLNAAYPEQKGEGGNTPMTKPKTPPETKAYDIRGRLHEILEARHINAASLATSVGMNQQLLYDCFAHCRRLEATELLRICSELKLTLDDFKQCL